MAEFNASPPQLNSGILKQCICKREAQYVYTPIIDDGGGDCAPVIDRYLVYIKCECGIRTEAFETTPSEITRLVRIWDRIGDKT